MRRQCTTHIFVSFFAYTQPRPFFSHRLMDSVSGSLFEMSNGEVGEIEGTGFHAVLWLDRNLCKKDNRRIV